MNKSGLIDAVSKTTSLAKREAEEAVNALVHVVASEVRSGRRVVVAGFGSFNPTHRGARTGRNPQTGEAVSIRASKGMRFAASALMKDILNGKAALPVLKPVTAKGTAAKQTAAKSTKKTAKPAPKTVKRSSTRPAARASTRNARRPAKKVVGRAPARKATRRAPASKAAKQSARKAAGRSPVRAAKRPARRP